MRDDDDIIDDEDDDDDDGYDDVDDAEDIGDDDDNQEEDMEETEKPVAKPAAPKPAARRAPMGLLQSRAAAKAAQQATVQAAVPPPPDQSAPKANLAKDGIKFDEDAFNAFLTAQGVDPAEFPHAQMTAYANIIIKRAGEALGTGTSPIDAWRSSVKHLTELVPKLLEAKKLDEATASKIQAVIRYFAETLNGIIAAEQADAEAQATKAAAEKAAATKASAERAEKARKTSAKETRVGVAPAAPVETKADEPKKAAPPKAPGIPCPKCGRESNTSYVHCLACGALLKPAAEPLTAPVALQPEVIRHPVTDPNGPTMLDTPAPVAAPAAIVTGISRPSITTPEQQALVANAAATVVDEPSVNFPLPPARQTPPALPPPAPAPAPSAGFGGPPPGPPPTGFVPAAPAAPVVPPLVPGIVPPAAPPPPPPAAVPPSPPAVPTAPVATKKSGLAGKLAIVAMSVLGMVLAITVWHFVVAPRLLAPGAQPPVATTANPPIAPAAVETCTKVTSAVLQRHFGQDDPTKFRFAKREGVRLDCMGKTIYKDPTSGLYDVRPCNVCSK